MERGGGVKGAEPEAAAGPTTDVMVLDVEIRVLRRFVSGRIAELEGELEKANRRTEALERALKAAGKERVS